MLNKFINSIYFKPLVFLFTAFLLYLECIVNHNKDFDVFIKASQLVYQKQNCYDVWIHVGSSGLKYFYSPLFAVILFPLIHLPQSLYHFVWLSLNLVMVYRVFKLLPFFLPIKKLSINQQQWFYLLAILASGRFFYDTFSLGQMTIALVWGTLESLRWMEQRKSWSGAALLALIINIKLIPVAVLAYIFYKGFFRAAFLTIVFSGLYLFLPAVFIGYEFNNELHANWLSSITATNSNSIMDDYGRQSLSSFFPAFLMDTPLQFGIKRNLANLDAAQVNSILGIARVLILGLLLSLFGRRFRVESRKALFYGIALICLITPLFFPHQGKYSFFYVLPAYAYVVYALIRLKDLKDRPALNRVYRSALLFTVISFVLLTLTTDGLLGRRLSDFCEYFQLITFGALSLLSAMIVLKTKTR